LINNRQAGRRRGRGGGSNNGQRQGGNQGRDNGNRIDSRSRGNAAQLLEKYKNLARDAQMSGDRVNTEYYLQFADHYFRVLSDARSRQDDQGQGQQQRRPHESSLDYEDEAFEDEGDRMFQAPRQDVDSEQQGNRFNGEREDRDQQQPRRDGRNGDGRNGYERPEQNRNDQNRGEQNRNEQNGRRPRFEREDEERTPRFERPARAEQPQPEPVVSQAAAPAPAPAEEEAPQPRRRGRPRREPVEAADTLHADLLPPSLNVSAVVANEDTPEEKPRRRRGRPPAAEAAAE
jgi:hypothetical protein